MEIPATKPDRTAELAAALAAQAAPPDAAGQDLPTPTPSASRSSVSRRSSSTTVDRMLARTSPYESLRLLGAILFGVGIAVSGLALLGGVGALVVLSIGGSPWAGVGVFVGALVVAVILLLGARTLSELVRLWADVGDRARHVAQMLEESLTRQQDEGE